jgi:hypothetical protein
MLTKPMLLVLLSGLPAPAQINILTANGGNDRTNANLQESTLSPATVSAASFGRVAAFPVDGPMYAQPLYVSGLEIPGVGTRNVLFVATMRNTIFAFDADADASSPVTPLWQASLGQPVPSTMLFGQYGDIGGDVGILSTPAIDLDRGLMYVVSDNLVGNQPTFTLHALDLLSGAEQFGGPVSIQGTVRGSGSGGSADGVVTFDPMQHIQRPGLLLANGAVYVSFGSHADQSPYHGWVMSYDAADLTHQFGVLMTTPDGDGGSVWQSGRGPAADGEGNVYVVTGNGDYNGVRNFAQSFLKLSGAAPVRVGAFTPADWKSLSDNDADLAAGPALIPGTHRLIGADKAGNLYLLDGEAMDGSGTAPAGAFQVIPASTGPIFNFALWGRAQTSYVYTQGSSDMLRCYAVTSQGLNPSPVSMASEPMRYSRIGMTLSAAGDLEGTGILWEITGNPHDTSASGTLRAYNASDLSNELWNSDMNSDDSMGPIMKFVSPTVANGRVYVPTFANVVMVYGLR